MCERSSLLGSMLLLALLVWMLLPAAPMSVEAGLKTFGEPVVIFEFSRPEPGKMEDYYFTILDISTEVFMREIKMADGVSLRGLIRRQQIGDTPELDWAREYGVSQYITGEYTVLRGNVRIRAQWIDLQSGRKVEEEAHLGKKDLDDFDLVETKVREFSRRLLDARFAPVDPQGGPRETMLVSCFTGIGGKADYGSGVQYLDSAITMELPSRLVETLYKFGVSPERFSVKALSPHRYRAECQAGYSGTSEEERYVLSGNLFSEPDRTFVKSRFYDRTRPIPISIPSFRGDSTETPQDLDRFINDLSIHLAKHLRNILVQRRLIEEGFDPGAVDGMWGLKTQEALRAYQKTVDLPTTGDPTIDTMKSLGLR